MATESERESLVEHKDVECDLCRFQPNMAQGEAEDDGISWLMICCHRCRKRPDRQRCLHHWNLAAASLCGVEAQVVYGVTCVCRDCLESQVVKRFCCFVQGFSDGAHVPPPATGF